MSNDVRDLIGQTFEGRYTIISRLGAGGMGTVYKALHIAMEREVAIKVLNSHLVNDDASRKRFVREMKATSAIESPYTVSVHDYGTTQAGEAFLVMEFLQGLTLKQLLRVEGALELDRLVTIAREVASALGSAHSRDIIHRDIKPENIILVDTFDGGEWTKVLDFGIAQIGLEDTNTSQDQLTAAGTVLGTPSYMSPERARGEAFDHRSDLYALGVLMYVMATGKAPYESNEPMGVLFKHITDPIPALADKSDREFPPWLEGLIHALMAKEASERPATAADFLTMLDAALSDSGYAPRSRRIEASEPEGAMNDAPTRMLPEAKSEPARPATLDTEKVGLSGGAATLEVNDEPIDEKRGGGALWGSLIGLLALAGVGYALMGSPAPGPSEGADEEASARVQEPIGDKEAREAKLAKVEGAVTTNPPPSADAPAKRRLVAVLFTDMVGYSSLMRLDEAKALKKLNRHDALLEEAFAKEEGKVVKRLGDGFMVEFRSSVEAVKAALIAQAALKAHNVGKAEREQIMVRMGVEVGDVVVRTEDLFGETVNVAAQIRRMAKPGTVAITQSVFTDIRGKLKASGQSLPPTKLKGRAAPLSVHLLEKGDALLTEVTPAPPGTQAATGSDAARSASPGAASTRSQAPARLEAAERLLKKSPAKALKAAMAILQEHPGDGPTMLLGAKARSALKQHGGALRALEACRSAQPGYVPCFFELGRAYEIAGQRDKAMDTYKALVEAHPGSVEALEAKERLSR